MKILLLDFDGVLHSYRSGWQGARKVSDTPVDGAIEFLLEAKTHFQVCIYSSRSRQWGGKRAMKRWLKKWLIDYADKIDISDLPAFAPSMEPWEHEMESWANQVLREINWPTKKPAAFLTIDDRCVCFSGTFPEPRELLAFKPWNKKDI